MNLVLVRIWGKGKKKTPHDYGRILVYLLAYLLTIIVMKLKIGVERGRVVTTLNILKH